MKKILAVCLLGVCLTANVAEAKKKGAENKKHYRHEIVDQRVEQKDTEEKEPWLKFRLNVPEKGILLRHSDEIIGMNQHDIRDLPPGLQKKVARGKRLPPGWQKKMAVGKTFPTSMYDHSCKLPDHIWRQLPPQPEGTVLIAVEGKIVRLVEATKTIIDVFDLKW
ncbi:MAG: hypothetical protein KKB51_01660 [Candidatus Riflebacteria bacterium]|nr:hypothetical protein [Candidatus Riflebacteria bacterium]